MINCVTIIPDMLPTIEEEECLDVYCGTDPAHIKIYLIAKN